MAELNLRKAARPALHLLSMGLMAGIGLWPDLIRLAVDEHIDEPTHGILGGGVRGMLALPLTIYVVLCMITKQALITG